MGSIRKSRFGGKLTPDDYADICLVESGYKVEIEDSLNPGRSGVLIRKLTKTQAENFRYDFEHWRVNWIIELEQE